MDSLAKQLLGDVVTTLIKGDTQACKDAFAKYTEVKVKAISDQIK